MSASHSHTRAPRVYQPTIRSDAKDILGNRYGRLTVIRHLGTCGGKNFYECRCDCGVIKELARSSLSCTVSCGCVRRKPSGMHPREYNSWYAAKSRCYREGDIAYARYGGRGIKMCSRWLNDFSAFLDDMGPRPLGTSLERKENDGNYEPGNCVWATSKAQMNNTRHNRRVTVGEITKTVSQWADETGVLRSTIERRLAAASLNAADAVSKPPRAWRRKLTWRGEARLMSQWADELGLTYRTVQSRLNNGWTIERALTQPLRVTKRTKTKTA